MDRAREVPARPVGRLAPSPTGRLHLGHARTFLLAWWHARARGGRVLMRIEDLDGTRVRPGMIEECVEDLAWLGLDWDGPVLVQTEGDAELRAAVAELERRDLVYPCVCTRKEIQLARSAPHAEDGTTRYPGTCRGRFASVAEAEARTGRRAALRLRVPAGAVELVDGFRGLFRCDVQAEVGDFPVTSRDGQVAYQLAVAVDDARQGVTEVLRGEDLLSSAARQYWIQESLGLAHPAWYHVPLVVDPAGRRLAKRADDLSLAHLRAAGAAPEAIVAWAARSAGQACGERARAADLVACFDLARVPCEPSVLDPETLATLARARRTGP